MNNIRMGWCIYAFFLTLSLFAMIWVSVAVTELEQADQNVRERTEKEELIRLALWRMDAAASSIISFIQWKNQDAPVSPFALFNFEIDQKTNRLRSNKKNLKRQEIAYNKQIPVLAICKALNNLESQQTQLRQQIELDKYQNDIQNEKPQTTDNQLLNPNNIANDMNWNAVKTQKVKATKEYQARQSSGYSNNGLFNSLKSSSRSSVVKKNKPSITSPQPQNLGTVLTPILTNNQLFVACTVDDKKGKRIQGYMMDWPGIKKTLEESCQDLLPQAKLLPLQDPNNYERRLASLPVTLDPGHIPMPEQAGFELGNTTCILILSWTGVLMAFGATGFLLHGANSLSKRRSTFVSAVTHELRTPLTTFRMYTDILLSGKLNQEKTSNYLNTLSQETDRLTHMVENVLAFSRLEKTEASANNESLALTTIKERCQENLENHSYKAGLQLNTYFDDKLNNTKVIGDGAGIEHILFNLVDNACKYAIQQNNKSIDLSFTQQANFVHISLRDHGPGIKELDKLFKPFSKSVTEAAQSKPGIGLGLALCKQFAREMKGDLIYQTANGGGSVFTLKLKIS